MGSLSPLAMNTGCSMAATRCSAELSGMPQVHTASYCASRVAQLVAVSRSWVRAYWRRRLSRPASLLVADGAKNTPMYSSALVCGVPTAPITSGALRRRGGQDHPADDGGPD